MEFQVVYSSLSYYFFTESLSHIIVKFYSQPEIFKALHQSKIKISISHSFSTGLLWPYRLTEKQFCWLQSRVGGSKTLFNTSIWLKRSLLPWQTCIEMAGNFTFILLWCKAANISGSEKTGQYICQLCCEQKILTICLFSAFNSQNSYNSA